MSSNSVSASMIVEAVLLTADKPLTIDEIQQRIARKLDVKSALATLEHDYAERSIALIDTGHGWCIRTHPENSDLCRKLLPQQFRLTKAAMETLSVIAYFQPITRSEIETVRGVSLGKGTMDMLIWSGLVRPGPRRQTAGLPMTFLTTDMFLERFDLRSIDDLPGLEELKNAGVLNPEKIGPAIADPLDKITET